MSRPLVKPAHVAASHRAYRLDYEYRCDSPNSRWLPGGVTIWAVDIDAAIEELKLRQWRLANPVRNIRATERPHI